MKWFRKIGYYAKEIRKEMRETGRANSSDFKSLQEFYSDKEKTKKALSMVDELIELYDDEEDKEKVVDLKEIKKLLLVLSINETAFQTFNNYLSNIVRKRNADTGRDSYNTHLEEIQKILKNDTN